MEQKRAKILNRYGLHTRPAAVLVTNASKFESEVYIIYNGVKINAKSILGVLTLAVEPGAEIIIEADGSDEKEAIEKLTELIENRFYLE